ncbi:AMP-dependent synthetase/ligase [Sinomonas mesophila]|uniref:AMP-dependent synthetase/ligase n=1 Tax=Sinomonas mesophila TaxID=1531955 RepID=UPI0009848B0C|nr:AMP-binding protein [Sinomonas mesophila]
MSAQDVHGTDSPRREEATDAVAGLDPSVNVTDLLLERAASAPDAELFARRTDAGWTAVTAAEFLDQVRALARGLIASGLDTGGRVAIVSASSYEWALVDFAVWFAGGVPVPVYETSSASQIASILADSGARRVFVQDADLARRVEDAVHGHPQLADTLLPITVMADDGEGATLRSLAGPGLGVSEAELERHRTAAGLDAVATLVYTSGTTGRPKGCEVTHGNLALLAVNLRAHLPSVVGPGARTLMFLPLAHVLARAVQVTCVAAGVVVGHSRQADLAADLGTFCPTFLLAVPRVFEKVYAGAHARASHGLRAAVFERAARTAREYSQALDDAASGLGDGPGRRLRVRHAVFDRLVYGQLRAAFGGRLTTIVSGASALSPALAHFFRGVGLTVLEGYGLTETTAPCTVNTPEATRVGTVGRPVPGTAIRISDSGEVLVKGIGVAAGYRGAAPGSPESQAFGPDGFLATGDLGQLDADGYLRITGRVKDILVTAGGKNVVPGPLEEALRESEL